MKSEKETVLELAVFFSTLLNDNWENILVVKVTWQTVLHYIQYRITEFVLLFTKRKILYNKCHQASGERSTK